MLAVAAWLGACIRDVHTPAPVNPDDGTALVRLEVRVPGNAVPSTRALGSPQEDEVTEIIVLAFRKGTADNWDTPLKHVGRSIGAPRGTGTTKEFTVELYSGEWDLWVLANSADIADDFAETFGVDLYSPGIISSGLTKSTLQQWLTKNVTGKWNVDPDDADGAYRMPMWGMMDAVRVQTSSTAVIQTVNLYRMLVRIDVEVQRAPDTDDPVTYPGIDMSVFELTYVSLHNYNTIGRLVPGTTAEDGNWTNSGGGAALRPSVPSDPYGVYGWEPAERLEWSDPADFTTAGTAVEGVIYTLEANAGTYSGNRPCLIVGGIYGSSGDVSYYRADFLDADKKYLDLLRNHKYTFVIRKIGGKGFPSVEEAYLAGPTNLEAEVIEWNDGGYLNGVWNGTYEIRFSDDKAHFTQFGRPDSHVLTVRTNVPTITLGDFTDFATGQGDAVWQQTADNRWTNGHFTVTFIRTATIGDYSDYRITITAEAAGSGDEPRLSTFMVKGYMLQVQISISQDAYLEYRLLTTPDHTRPLTLDGTQQLVRVDVTTTHPYKIEFNNYPMFLGAYTDAAGTRPVADITNIPASVSTVWVGIGAYSSAQTRVGEFTIRHVDTSSTADIRIYSVMQLSPILLAELEDGGYSAKVNKGGGSHTINVTSNLAKWNPVLTIDGQPYSGNLSQYFSVVNGSQTQQTVFTAPAMPAGATTDRVYSITFEDANPQTGAHTKTPIVITQRAISGTPPHVGVRAPADFLAVNSQGELNLDGDGYMVYFMWGSMIAITGSPEQFDASQIAWVPDGYDIDDIGGNWNNIPYGKGASFPGNVPTVGLGDPCAFASKGGLKGGYKMPQGPYWFENIPWEPSYWGTRSIQGTNVTGRTNSTRTNFYPAAGTRWNGGALNHKDTLGYYWIAAPSGSDTTVARSLYFSATQRGDGATALRNAAYPIRCIPN